MTEVRISDGIMQVRGVNEFSLERSCNCGQAFRWVKRDNVFRCVLGETIVSAWQKDEVLFVAPCENETWAEYYLKYFDLKRDYKLIEEKMSRNTILRKCIPYAGGIRVFAQEPFETLITFIISANNNIKRITSIVDRLCKECGERLVADDGTEFYTFPDAKCIAALSVEELHAMGMGYRDTYVKRTAQAIADGFSLEEIKQMPYHEAKKRLCTLYGVGGKVADCVLLFALDHGEAFPMDVWMKKAVSCMFFEGKEPQKKQLAELLDSFGSDAGRIQQYIFHYARETGLKETEYG